MSKSLNIKAIAFYLPQYHPIPENDEWWGKGFTEWTNVTKAKPLFKDHNQPHLPADLGFYDLRLQESRQAQVELAQKYNIHGFCYYHYWFNSKRLLEQPVDQILASGKPDFPFCLCWANENWTRRWDGQDQEILIEQVYSEEDDRLHMQWLAQAFKDSRYIKINGKPLFLVYRVSNMPNPFNTADVWREEAKKLGFEDIYLCNVESIAASHIDPSLIGFDAAIEFQPNWEALGQPLQKGRRWNILRHLKISELAYGKHNIYEYSTVVESQLDAPIPSYKRFLGVSPSWDNSARRKINAIILRNASPEVYENWLKIVIQRTLEDSKNDEKLIFINAWNEWAEGNHLEPCQKWGHEYLMATSRAIQSAKDAPNPNKKQI